MGRCCKLRRILGSACQIVAVVAILSSSACSTASKEDGVITSPTSQDASMDGGSLIPDRSEFSCPTVQDVAPLGLPNKWTWVRCFDGNRFVAVGGRYGPGGSADH